jgi:uncharacterized protein (DUF1330 family)
MLKNAFMMTVGISIGAGAISALHAQSSIPYYLVAAINVKDQKAYENSGVDKVRNAITGLSGGILIAGGYGKATVLDGTLDANRFLIFQFANKAALDKAWTEHIKPWQMRENVRQLADFHTISVEGVDQK